MGGRTSVKNFTGARREFRVDESPENENNYERLDLRTSPRVGVCLGNATRRLLIYIVLTAIFTQCWPSDREQHGRDVFTQMPAPAVDYVELYARTVLLYTQQASIDDIAAVEDRLFKFIALASRYFKCSEDPSTDERSVRVLDTILEVASQIFLVKSAKKRLYSDGDDAWRRVKDGMVDDVTCCGDAAASNFLELSHRFKALVFGSDVRLFKLSLGLAAQLELLTAPPIQIGPDSELDATDFDRGKALFYLTNKHRVDAALIRPAFSGFVLFKKAPYGASENVSTIKDVATTSFDKTASFTGCRAPVAVFDTVSAFADYLDRNAAAGEKRGHDAIM